MEGGIEMSARQSRTLAEARSRIRAVLTSRCRPFTGASKVQPCHGVYLCSAPAPFRVLSSWIATRKPRSAHLNMKESEKESEKESDVGLRQDVVHYRNGTGLHPRNCTSRIACMSNSAFLSSRQLTAACVVLSAGPASHVCMVLLKTAIEIRKHQLCLADARRCSANAINRLHKVQG